MSYLSLGFVAFVALCLILYYLVPKKIRYVVLLAASIFFYACFDLRYLLFLLVASASTFFCALFLPKMKRAGLWIGGCIAFNAAIWFAIKELPWLLLTANRLLQKIGLPTFPALSWLVPVGLSYFTLQAIAYLVDVSKGKVQAETNFSVTCSFYPGSPPLCRAPSPATVN